MIAYEYKGFIVYSTNEDYFKIRCEDNCINRDSIEKAIFIDEKEAEEFIDELKDKNNNKILYPEQTTMKLIQTKYKDYQGSIYVLKLSNNYANKTKGMSPDLYDPNTIIFLDKEAAKKSAYFRTGNWIVVKLNKI